MREKLQTLPLTELKEMAKSQGLKGVSTMRKGDLIDLLCAHAEQKTQGTAVPKKSEEELPQKSEPQEAPVKEETPQASSTAPAQTSTNRIQIAMASDHANTRTNSYRNNNNSQSNYTPRYQTRSYGPNNRQQDNRRNNNSSRYERGNQENRYYNRNSYQQNSYQQSAYQQNSYQTNTYQQSQGNGNSQGNDVRGYAESQNRSGYVDNRSNYNDNRGYNENRSYGDNRANYNETRSSYNDNRANYGETRPSYSENRASYGDSRPVYGDSRANYEDNRQSYGEPAQNYEEQPIRRFEAKNDALGLSNQDLAELDSGLEAKGILEVMPDGFGFIRCENFLPGDNDVYVAPSQIRRFNLKTGDIIEGNRRVRSATEKFAALLYIKRVNGLPLSETERRPNFEDLTPIFPNERLHMECLNGDNSVAMRVLDLLAPVGKGQRGMIVSPPKAGKTTLLKQVAKAVTTNYPDMHLMILLIDERPEEVTDIKEAIVGPNVEVIYSTFDEEASNHKRVSEMVIERAKRLVEHGRDVMILLDSITRLTRAYNLTVTPSGRTLSGGLDPAALYMPKRFFGAARKMREGGSLTILATALVDTGSRMDDVVYEEFKGTGNMELMLDRKLSEKRIFPAIDILRSGTRRDDLLLNAEEKQCVDTLRRAINTMKPEEAVEKILDMFYKTKNNKDFANAVAKIQF